MTRRQALNDAIKRLRRIDAFNPESDARIFLAEAVGMPRISSELSILLTLGEEMKDRELAEFDRLLTLRESGVPLQYALGEAHFYGRFFSVDQNVLIPRFDTERLCDAAMIRMRDGFSVLDIGTGSGAIAITMALGFPSTHVFAVDISEASLAVARKNAERHSADVLFMKSDIFSSLDGCRFDVILSNPPYIPEAEMPTLPTEVRRELEIALNGGADGLSIIRRIVEGLPDHLARGGSLVLEVGDGQAGRVMDMLKGRFDRVSVQRDYNQLERVVTGDRYAG